MLSSIIRAAMQPKRTGAPSAFHDFEHPLQVAHRGGMALWPENTMLAFEQAEIAGATALEMDVHRTADGELVVSHDPAVDRCTEGKGAIEQLTRAQVQSFDAGYRFSTDGGDTFPFREKGVRIPTMREVFERFGHLRFIIDSKPPRPEVALQLAALAKECGVADRVCLASFHLDNVLAIRRDHPEIATSLSEPEVMVFWAAQAFFLDGLYRAPAGAMQVPPSQYGVPFLTRRFVEVAHAHDMLVQVWTVNDERAMRRLLDLGVDGIITDYPDRLGAVSREWQNRRKPA